MTVTNFFDCHEFFLCKRCRYCDCHEFLLEMTSTPVIPEEFLAEMKGNLFCPACCTPLSRSPDLKNVSINSQTAHFKHLGKYSDVQCNLRTERSEGVRYKNEEEAAKAIEDGNLTIISNWMENPPSYDDDIDNEDEEFRQRIVEDEDGPTTEVAIPRHVGADLILPSRVSTVAAICRNFDKNLCTAFHFPESNFPRLLSDMLFNSTKIDRNTSPNKRLFFGCIDSYQKLNHRNVINLKGSSSDSSHSFKIYTWPRYDERKHIDYASKGRYMLFYTDFYREGYTPTCKLNNWGEYSLLPKKYEKHLRIRVSVWR